MSIKLKNNRGSILLGTLIIVLLTGIYVAFAQGAVVRLTRSLWYEKRSLLNKATAENRIFSTLAFLDENKSSLFSSADLDNSTLTRMKRAGLPPLFFIQEINTPKVLEPRPKHLLLRLTYNNSAPISYPDWGRLSSAFATDKHCENWQENSTKTSTTPKFSSHRTCTAILPPLRNGMFIDGNLELDSSLILQGLNNEKLYLVIAGGVILKKPLVIKKSSNSSIELIAAGSIELDTILSKDVSNIKVLIYSAGGKITANLPPTVVTALANCDISLNSSLFISLEANGLIVLNNATANRDNTFGCPYRREQFFWPYLKVIGSG